MEINRNFLEELFKSCLSDRSVFRTVRGLLKYTHLPAEEYKYVWKSIVEYENVNNKMPTIGILSSYHSSNDKVLSLLNTIKDTKVKDHNSILETFDDFISNAEFIEFYEEIGNLFKNGSKDEAKSRTKDYVEKANKFSVKGNYYTLVLKDYQDRQQDRVNNRETGQLNSVKIPFGIDQLDKIAEGGMSVGDIALFLGQSSVGKSKVLKYVGSHAAKLGYKVLHIQAESSKVEAEELYDSTFSGQPLFKVKYGLISDEDKDNIDEKREKIVNRGGEIILHSFIDEARQVGKKGTMADVANVIEDVEKIHGKIDLVVIDYLEKIDTGDGKRYKVSEEKLRRNAIAELMKDVAVRYKTRVVTATQASLVDKEDLDDPNKYMTRHNISLDKNLINPFDFFITLNQTKDEKRENLMRLFPDKVRNSKNNLQLFTIVTAYDTNRFCDRRETINRGYYVPSKTLLR